METSFGKTFVRTSGPKDAAPLVLLNGMTGNSLNWTPNVRGLSQVFQVFAIDAIHDWGKSVYTKLPKDGSEFCDWLSEVLDGLGLHGGVHLAGVSYGGWITAEFALRRRERLRSAVLLAPGFVVLPLDWTLNWYALPMLLPHPYFAKRFYNFMFADTAQQGEEGKKIIEEWAHDTFVGRQCFPIRLYANPRVFEDADIAAISVPTLFLIGENEKMYPAAKAIARLGRVAPRIETEVIKNAGHDLTIAQANLVNEKIIAFARRHEGGARGQ